MSFPDLAPAIIDEVVLAVVAMQSSATFVGKDGRLVHAINGTKTGFLIMRTQYTTDDKELRRFFLIFAPNVCRESCMNSVRGTSVPMRVGGDA
jgi:hypothetical protein